MAYSKSNAFEEARKKAEARHAKNMEPPKSSAFEEARKQAQERARKSKASSVDQAYIDDYFTQANKFLAGYGGEEGHKRWAEEGSNYQSGYDEWKALSERGAIIETWLEMNKDSFDPESANEFRESLKRSRQYLSEALGQSYFNDFYSRSNSFLDGYDQDAGLNRWSTADADYQGRYDEWKDLDQRRAWIENWMGENPGVYTTEESEDITDSLKAYRRDLSMRLGDYHDLKANYNLFDTEDEYNAYLEAEKLRQQMMGEDLGLLEKEIQELENQRDSYEYDWTDNQQRKAAEEHIEEYNKQISAKRQYYNKAKLLQEGAAMAGVVNNDDFQEYSGYASTESGKWYDFITTEKGMGYNDLTYEYINNQNGIREEIDRRFTAQDGATIGGSDSKFEYRSLAYMTAEEVAIYNYYYAKNGKEAAEKYLDTIQEDLNTRKAYDIREELKGHTASQILHGYAAGWDQFDSGLKSLFNTESDYIPTSYVQLASGMIREDLGQAGPKLPQWLGGASLGQIGYDAVNTTSHMLPSILASSVSNVLVPGSGAYVGNALTFASSAGNSYQEALNAGYSKEQARSYSTLVGASEAGLQYFLGGISKLGGKVSGSAISKMMSGIDSALGKAALQLTGSMLSEGMEEGLQEIMTTWFKNLTLHAGEDINWEEVAYSSLMGMLTSGIMEIGGSTLNKVVSKVQGTQSREGSAPVGADGVQQRTDRADVAHAPGREAPVSLYDDAAVNETSRQEPAVQETAAEDPLWALAQEVAADQREAENARQEDLDGAETAADAREDIGDVREQTQSEEAYGAVKEAPAVQNRQTAQPAEAASDPVWEAAHTVARETRQQQEAPAEEQLTDAQPETVQQTKAAEKERLIYGKYTGIREIQRGKVLLDLFNGDVNDSSKMDPNWHEEFNACKLLSRIREHIDIDTGNQLLGKLAEHPYAVEGASVRGMEQAYNYGYAGYDRSAMEGKNTMAALVPEAVRNILYDMGAQYRQTVDAGKAKGKTKPAPKPKTVKVKSDQNIKPVREDSGKHRGPDLSRYKNVQFEGDITRWGKKQQAEVEFVDFIAKNFSGNRVLVYESYKNADGKYVYTDSLGRVQKAHNGVYVAKNGDIYLDLNAGNHSEGLVLNTFAHELYHHIEKQAPEQAKALADFLVKELGEENVEAAVNRQIEKARNAGYGEGFFEEQGMSAEEARQTVRDRAYSDFIADGLETMFTKGDVVQKLADLHRQDKGLFHTIRKFIRKWVSKLREFYNAGNTLSIEGRLVAELETFDKIQQMFAEALKVAGENYRAQKNTAGGGGVDLFSAKEAEAGAKYAGRDTNGKKKITISMTDSERTEILKGKVITAEVYEGQADAFVEKAEEDLKSQKDNLIKRALIKIGEEFGVFTDYRISDVEVDIRLSRGNMKESVAKKADPIQIAKLLPVLKTAVENAVGIECHANRYYYDNNTVMFENLIGGYVEGKHFVPVRLGLRHSMNGSVTLYLIVDQHKIDIKKMKAEVAKAAVMQKHHADDTSRSAFNISLASIVPFVNSKDLLRYLPDNMLTDHQRTAKWEAIADTVKYTNDKNDLHYIKCLQSGNLSGAKQMVQQAAKTAGYTRLFYHGAKKGGGFTRFHSWSYFTENKRYAERYAQRDNPESLYTVYAKMDKPFDTRNADARDLFQQIHDEYGLSDIQESGLPDWTDGYDIADFIDENDLDYDSIVLDEGGDMVDGKPVSRGPSYVVRNSEQVKSADVVTYDDDGNIIPLSWRFNMKNPDIRYSTRDTESVSNRSLLANALDSVVQDESEKRRLEEYREAIGKLEGYEKELAGYKEKLAALEGSKKPRDVKERRRLKDEAIKTANRIDIYDKKLLRLEGEKPLERILNRERKRVLAEMQKKYGTIKHGEKAVRDDSLPVSTDGKNKVSLAARTVKGAGVTTDELADAIDAEVVQGGLTYIPLTNNKTNQKAREWLRNEGWEDALREWHDDVIKCKSGADMFARGAVLLNNAAQAGNKKVWRDILYDYQFLNTTTAQGLQAAKILKQLQPEDKLYMVRRSIKQMVKDMRLQVDIQLNKECVQAYKEAKTEEERDAIMAQIQQDVADQIPSTFMDKWTALRYVNMLGNLRTQARNVIGNVAMMATTRFKDVVAAGLEQIAYKASGGKFNRTKALANNRELLKAAKNDFDTVESLVLDGGKYNDQRAQSAEFAKGVMEKQRIFGVKKGKWYSKGVNGLLFPLEGYRKLTNWAMDKGDVIFSKAAYGHALANYLQAHGVKTGDFSTVDPALLDDARVYAVQQAQEATFRDTNTLSGWVSTLGRKPTTPVVGRVLSEGTVPFRKTPANMLVRAEEYSPMGILNSLGISLHGAMGHSGLVNNNGFLGKIAKSGEQITGGQIVESWAKTITGTGLFALGMLLRNIGVLIGGPDDDEKLDKFEDLNGQQNYAFHIGDMYFTVDFLSPSVIPMFMGAQMLDLYQENGFQFKDLESAFTSLADPMVEMSMLQGLNDTLENVQYAENNLMQIAISASLSYLTQGLTNSMLGQIERGVEDSRRSTYVDKDGAAPGWLQSALGKASAKTPVWDYNQIPFINAWGEEEENPTVALNLIYNMLSPSYISKETKDIVSQELTRLNEVQSDENVFPSTPEKEYDGRYLTAEEYVALARNQGQTQRQIIEKMVDSSLYDGLPDAYKAKAVSLAYQYAKESAQIEELGREGFSSDWMAEIKGNTAEGIVKHVIKENIKNMYLSGDISADEAIRRRIEYYGDTEDEAAEKIAYWDFQVKNPEYADWNESMVTRYKDLDPKTAAHVVDVLGKLNPEDGYTNVRPIQKIEAITGDSKLSDKDKDTALRALMDDKLEAKYDSAREMGIGSGQFALAYRKYQDTEGKGKKKAILDYFQNTLKIGESEAKELYDLFDGKEKE